MKKSTRSSTAVETFVDTSGFHAVLVKHEPMHSRATAILARAAQAGGRFVTTDYVLDETATLLKARGHRHLAAAFFASVFSSAACRIEWMDPDRFQETQRFFLKHQDQDWSFTDCLSFWMMHLLQLRDALTTDRHFRQAGFNPLLM
jgi:predicted nucleic acid-binding protein